MEVITTKYVLLVGETEALASITGRLLERKGFQVFTVVGIRQAEAAITQQMPGLILMDCNLPDGSGIAACRRWKFHKYPAKIFLTSNATSDEVIALNAGADDFIKKPYCVEVLLARMRRLCKTL